MKMKKVKYEVSFDVKDNMIGVFDFTMGIHSAVCRVLESAGIQHIETKKLKSSNKNGKAGVSIKSRYVLQVKSIRTINGKNEIFDKKTTYHDKDLALRDAQELEKSDVILFISVDNYIYNSNGKLICEENLYSYVRDGLAFV
jgi:hypothetical protein